MEFTGTWHIYEMSNWDDEYFNMEVQAYIILKLMNKEMGSFSLDWLLDILMGILLKMAMLTN